MGCFFLSVTFLSVSSIFVYQFMHSCVVHHVNIHCVSDLFCFPSTQYVLRSATKGHHSVRSHYFSSDINVDCHYNDDYYNNKSRRRNDGWVSLSIICFGWNVHFCETSPGITSDADSDKFGHLILGLPGNQAVRLPTLLLLEQRWAVGHIGPVQGPQCCSGRMCAPVLRQFLCSGRVCACPASVFRLQVYCRMACF